jgi:hypothetical protein
MVGLLSARSMKRDLALGARLGHRPEVRAVGVGVDGLLPEFRFCGEAYVSEQLSGNSFSRRAR